MGKKKTFDEYDSAKFDFVKVLLLEHRQRKQQYLIQIIEKLFVLQIFQDSTVLLIQLLQEKY